MGLIKAGVGAAGGVLADQWKEYFYCDALDMDTLAVKGQKRVSGRSSNTKASDNIISTGSVVAVADGQCMIIVEQGKVVEVCAEPGEFTFDSSSEPTIFSGKLTGSIVDSLKNIGKRFTFGGEPPMDQRVYYINTKELVGNKYGTAQTVPFKIEDPDLNFKLTVNLKCFGEYSYHVTDPVLLYTNVMGNMTDRFTRDQIDSQLKSELLTALQPAFAAVSAQHIEYDQLPAHTQELADLLNKELSSKWHDLRGIEIVSFGISSVKADEEDEKRLKEMQVAGAMRDQTMAAANLTAATAEAMRTAAANDSGAMNAFMGMGMASAMGGGQAANMFAQANSGQQAQPAASVSGWACACGAAGNTGNYCGNCGAPKPAPAGEWTCSCGAQNSGNFCSDCGATKPTGSKCSKCGWVSQNAAAAPKFCPECGTPFQQ